MVEFTISVTVGANLVATADILPVGAVTVFPPPSVFRLASLFSSLPVMKFGSSVSRYWLPVILNRLERSSREDDGWLLLVVPVSDWRRGVSERESLPTTGKVGSLEDTDDPMSMPNIDKWSLSMSVSLPQDKSSLMSIPSSEESCTADWEASESLMA